MAYPYYGNYMNYYQPGYQVNHPMNQPMMNQQPQQIQPTIQQEQQTSSGIIWVQGEEGAKAYMVAPGNSVLLMDSENSSFYIKSSDASGMPMPLRVFDYTERTSQKQATHSSSMHQVEYVTREEFNALAARLDAMTEPKPATRKSTAQEESNNG